MSFKEIKSLLRMVNVDMNDMYAYRLFKVGSCHHSDLCCLPSPSRLSHQLPPHPPILWESGLSLQKGHIWAWLPFYPPLRPLGWDGSVGPELLSSPRQSPSTGRASGLPTPPK